MFEERKVYLDQQKDYANVFYTRRFIYKVWKGLRFQSASGKGRGFFVVL